MPTSSSVCPVDSREYGIGAQILMDLGVTTMRVMTNNPMKYTGLDGFGLDIVGRVPLNTEPNPENHAYLTTKRDRLGHLLTGLDVQSRRNEIEWRYHGRSDGPRGGSVEARLTSDETTRLEDTDLESIEVSEECGHRRRRIARCITRSEGAGVVRQVQRRHIGSPVSRSLDAFEAHGVKRTSVRVAWVPGAFELPLAASRSN